MSDLASLLEMIARRAPQLMRTGGIVGQPRRKQFQRPNVTPALAAEMVRRIHCGETLAMIAGALDLLPDCVAKHTRHARVCVHRPRRAA